MEISDAKDIFAETEKQQRLYFYFCTHSSLSLTKAFLQSLVYTLIYTRILKVSPSLLFYTNWHIWRNYGSF